MENIWNYIADNVLYLVPALIIIGKFVKSVPNIANWVIPFVLLVLGVLASNLIIGFSAEATVQGVLVAGAAVFSNQIVKQAGNAVHGSEQNINYDSEIQGEESEAQADESGVPDNE